MTEAEDSRVAEVQNTFICELCGRDKPVEQVFQCTVCLKEFCITHLGGWVHGCYNNEMPSA